MNIKVVKDKKDAQVTFRIAKDGEDPVRIIKELKDSVGYNYDFSEDYIRLDVDSQKVNKYMTENLPKLSYQYKEVNIFNNNIKFLFNQEDFEI